MKLLIRGVAEVGMCQEVQQQADLNEPCMRFIPCLQSTHGKSQWKRFNEERFDVAKWNLFLVFAIVTETGQSRPECQIFLLFLLFLHRNSQYVLTPVS